MVNITVGQTLNIGVAILDLLGGITGCTIYIQH